MFLNLGSLKMCGLQVPEFHRILTLAREVWELKSTHLPVAKIEKHYLKGCGTGGKKVTARYRIRGLNCRRDCK